MFEECLVLPLGIVQTQRNARVQTFFDHIQCGPSPKHEKAADSWICILHRLKSRRDKLSPSPEQSSGSPQKNPPSRDQLTGPFIETAIRLGALAILLYWTLILVRPFISIVIWSVVLDGCALSCFRVDGSSAWRTSPTSCLSGYNFEPADCHWSGDVARLGADRKPSDDLRTT